ncbi:MAG: hypothetical protein KDB53_03945, partial [Planctomycetes bacterium]|nr:hypothetical protein [Planctomycetota bacterium]
MTTRADKRRAFFDFGDRIRVLPVVHGSADFALAVREELLANHYDCLAVPLPASFEPAVMDAVALLPQVSMVVQTMDDEGQTASHVPIDPCQPVIRGLRMAQAERKAIAFIDLEHREVEGAEGYYPDAFALKGLAPDKFAAAVLSVSEPPAAESLRDRRCRHMAFQLGKLSLDFERILFLPSIADWPFIRDAFVRRLPYPEEVPYFAPIHCWPVAKEGLFFYLAELPFITALYEKVRFGIEDERSMSVDGVKELVLESRDRLVRRKASARRRISIKTMGIYLQYVRNLTLLSRRLRPELVTLLEAAKQVCGDDFAITMLEVAREYPFGTDDPDTPRARASIDSAELPELGTVEITSRLPGAELEWRSIDLRREPDEPERKRWKQVWNPHEQCSYPPEDRRIESFNLHVREQAKSLISNDLARSEKFTSSLKDGLDIRETLRNWHTKDLYVREVPPARGSLEIVVFLFDVPAEANMY